MKRARTRSILPWIYAGSLLLHVALGLILARLPTSERSRVVSIDFAEFKKKRVDVPAPPRPPPAALKEHRAKGPLAPPALPAPTRATDAPAKEATRPSGGDADGFVDLGAVALSGAGAGPPGGRSAAASPGGGADAPKPTAHRVKQLAPTAQNDCTDAVVKPRVKTPGQITYTKEGQEAEIEGVVRVQVTVDESGHVIAASVISPLGYGLDDKALAAARDTLFEPATLCGKAVIGTRVVAFTFELR